MKRLKAVCPVLLCFLIFSCNSMDTPVLSEIDVEKDLKAAEAINEQGAEDFESYLYRIEDEEQDDCGYVDYKGDTIIPFGKYWMCFQDTLKRYAIVMTTDFEIIGIDKNEKKLWKPFIYDNGPDYIHEGTFRIVIDDKMGFLDAESGEIIVAPQFDFVDFFVGGLAEYVLGGGREYMGEHWTWVGGYDGGYVNKKGELFETADPREGGGYNAVVKGSDERVVLDSLGFIIRRR